MYCKIVEKFISLSLKKIKESFFNLIDLNDDKKICETDIFNLYKFIDTSKTQQSLEKDIQ